MAKIYIDNGDGTYSIENSITCCSRTNKADLQNHITHVTATIAFLQARLADLTNDLAELNLL